MELKYKRILLKLSGEFLGGEKGFGFDFDVIGRLSDSIQELKKMGCEIGIVIGGGNFFRGTQSIPLKIDRVNADKIGMLATAMNSICLKEVLKLDDQSVELMNGLRIPGIGKDFSKEKAVKALEKGKVVIFAGGTGNPYFSTDTAAALRALEIEADMLIKGTKVDGVFDKDPEKFSDAVKYESLTFSEALNKDLKVMDGSAMALLRDNTLPLSVVNLSDKEVLVKLLTGESVGTIVSN